MSLHHSDQMSQRSQVSRVTLYYVWLLVVTEGPTKGGTRCPIELLWTAKKHFGWPKVIFEMLYQVFATLKKGYPFRIPVKHFEEEKKLFGMSWLRRPYVARYKAENDQMCFLCFMSFCVFFFIAILFNRFVFYVFLCFFLSNLPRLFVRFVVTLRWREKNTKTHYHMLCFCVFLFKVLLTFPAMCFLCFCVFFLFKLLSCYFCTFYFCHVFCSPWSSILSFFIFFKLSFFWHLFYVLLPFLFYFLFSFSQPFFMLILFCFFSFDG